MAQEPALSLPKGGPFEHGGGKRAGDAARAKIPGGVPSGFAQWLNRTAVEQVRA